MTPQQELDLGVQTPPEEGHHHIIYNKKAARQCVRFLTASAWTTTPPCKEEQEVRGSRGQQRAAGGSRGQQRAGEVTAALIAIPRYSVNARRQRPCTSRK